MSQVRHVWYSFSGGAHSRDDPVTKCVTCAVWPGSLGWRASCACAGCVGCLQACMHSEYRIVVFQLHGQAPGATQAQGALSCKFVCVVHSRACFLCLRWLCWLSASLYAQRISHRCLPAPWSGARRHSGTRRLELQVCMRCAFACVRAY
jgi:hypothetical protein